MIALRCGALWCVLMTVIKLFYEFAAHPFALNKRVHARTRMRVCVRVS